MVAGACETGWLAAMASIPSIVAVPGLRAVLAYFARGHSTDLAFVIRKLGAYNYGVTYMRLF